MTGRPTARIGLGVPAALAATGAAIPLAWNGLPKDRDVALVGGALALSAAISVAAAALVRQRLYARLARGEGRPGAALGRFPAAFTAAVTLSATIAAFAALTAAAHLAGLEPAAWAKSYGLSAAFVSLAFLVPLHLWARAGADGVAAEIGGGDPGDRPARRSAVAAFEWLAASAAVVVVPISDRGAHLAGNSVEGALPAAVQLAVALAIAAIASALVAALARRWIAPRIAAVDGVPGATPSLPASGLAAELDREISQLGEQYAAALKSQGALIEARRRTREQKAKVFASMSHDLRGPLNSIVGFSDLLLKGIDGALSDRQRDTVISISREAERLLVLTGDILDTAKLDAGRFELERVWVPTNELLAACEDAASRFVAPRGISFCSGRAPGLPPLFVDKERFVGVMVGLISRAADAMDGGSLLLAVREVSSMEEGRDYALFSLVDEQGRADPAWRTRAFDVFASFEGHALPGDTGGLALGLTLAERILRLHGGELAVGAVADEPLFTIALPLDRTDIEG